jgi:peroxiredoxin
MANLFKPEKCSLSISRNLNKRLRISLQQSAYKQFFIFAVDMKILKTMRLKLIVLLMVMGAFGASAQNKGGYSIKGKIFGIKDTVVQLGNYYGDKQYLKDSARVDSQGKFAFEGKEKLDGGIYIVITPDKKYFELIIDSVQNFSFETDTLDYVNNLKVKGSPENILFYEYLNYINPKGKKADELKNKLNDESIKDDSIAKAPIIEELKTIDKEVNDYKKLLQEKHPQSFVAKMFKAMEEPEIPEAPILENGRKDSTFAYRYYKTHFWDNVDLKDDRILRTPIYHNRLKKYIEQLTIQIPDSINKTADELLERVKDNKELFKYTLWYITNTYQNSNYMGMDAVFVHLVENYYSKKLAYWVDEDNLKKIEERAKLLKPLLIGKVAPNMVMRDTNDVAVSLHQIKGKFTILYFWDPDCGHCQKVSPKVFEVYEKYKSKGVTTFAVCTVQDKEKFKKFVREKNLKWNNVYDPFPQYNLKNMYDIYSTPVIYLLNEKKEIIFKRIGHEQLDEILEKEFEKLK